jgi:hypothetical protein
LIQNLALGPSGPIFEILGGFDRGQIFDDFWSGQTNEKMRRRCEKRISAGRVGGTPVLPEELLEFAKSKEFVRVCKESRTPCPLRAGGGGLLSLRELRRPTSKQNWSVGLVRFLFNCERDLRGLVVRKEVILHHLVSFGVHFSLVLVSSILRSQIALGCAPRRFRKRSREQKHAALQMFWKMVVKWDPAIARLVIFSMIGSKILPNDFWYGCWMVFWVFVGASFV